MFFVKFIIILLLLSFSLNNYASEPSYYYRIPTLVESEIEFYSRIKKYDYNRVFDSEYIGIDNFRGIIKSISYHFTDYQINNMIVPSVVVSEKDKENFIILLNVVTDDENQSQYIFDEFYVQYLEDFYKSKERCVNFCVFTKSVDIDGFRLSGLGEISPKEKYRPYLSYFSVRRLTERENAQ